MADCGVVVQDEEIIIDWDHLLDNIPDDLDFDFFDEPAAGGLSVSPDSGCSLSIDDVEKYLMLDESNHQDQNVVMAADEFLSDVLLLDSSSPESGGSDRSKDSASPESVEIVTDEEEEKKKRENGADVSEAKENNVDDVLDDDDGNPVAKKRKRQMRNRDAAVRSRERKKMYVKDLEMKSKYYEAECKRLGIMLQCCLAENQALRLSMHNTKAFDVSMSKQESAVLLLESLLLGSLLGFLGIIYLLILPSQLLSILEMGLVGNEEWGSLAPRKTVSKGVLFHSFMMGKRCKASRSRMKLRNSRRCVSWFLPGGSSPPPSPFLTQLCS